METETVPYYGDKLASCEATDKTTQSLAKDEKDSKRKGILYLESRIITD
jgi:hypothetical protein